MAVLFADLFPTLRSLKSKSGDEGSTAPARRGHGKRRQKASKRVAETRASEISFETLEPRLLLSADLSPIASGALADGLDQFDIRLDNFVLSDSQFGERVPILLDVKKGPNNTLINEAPSVRELFAVPVDANRDGKINPQPLIIDGLDDDNETDLDALDINNDDVVDVSEFLEAWLWDPISDWLNNPTPPPLDPNLTTDDFITFVESSLDKELQFLGEYNVRFEIVDSRSSDTTEDPDAETTYGLGFKLEITRDGMPIDLGLQADALKLVSFTGSPYDPKLPTVPVTSTLTFGFDFGVFTGGQAVVDQNDFFIRSADPLALSVKAKNTDLPDFNFYIGFLGAMVKDGSLDLRADVNTNLLDPNDPDVLGFVDSQHGVEQTSGVVEAENPASLNLGQAAGFFLRVGNVGIATPVTLAAGNRASLAALETDLESAISAAGLGGLVDVSRVGAGSDTFQFALVGTTSNALEFANEALSLTGTLAAGTVDGDGGTDFEYASDQTFLLSVGGALPKLVRVNFADPSHTDIGFNDGQAAGVPDLVAASAAASPFDITANAVFDVTVYKSDGTSVVASVTLTAAETDGNASAADLASDLDTKIYNSPVGLLVIVEALGDGRLRFRDLDSTVSAIRVQTSGTGVSEIGFASDTVVGLQLTAAGSAVSNLTEAANFRLSLKTDTGGGTATSTYVITVPDNNRATLAALATDINAAIDSAVGSDLVNAFVSGGKIVLAATNTNVLAFSVRTINQDIGDLVADVNRALATAGLGGQVTASNSGNALVLTAAGGKSLEISRTLTFDAGVTYAELTAAPIDKLFDASQGATSHVELKFPVTVNAGLEDATTAANDDWRPDKMAIVGNFNPFDVSSNIASYDDQAKRFLLNFTYDPDTAVPAQDTPVNSVPSIGSLSDEIRLVNFAEALNFNLLGPESMVGLLESLGTALQQIANSKIFAGHDIPFVDASLSDLLNFADDNLKEYTGLVDILLFDTGGDGIGGGAADVDGLLKKVTAKINGVDQTFVIPAFTTAQQLASTLAKVLGVSLEGADGIHATYDRNTNELTYKLDLMAGPRTAVTDAKELFEYDVALSPFAKLSVDAAALPADKEVALSGRTGFQATIGIDLSPPGAVIYPTTKLSELNGGGNVGSTGSGVGIKYERAITGTVAIPVVGKNDPAKQQLPTGDAEIWIKIGTDAPVKVTIDNSSTVNRSMADLAEDVKNSLSEAGLADRIVAGYDVTDAGGARLVLSGANKTIEFSITQANGAAETDLGLKAGMVANQVDFVIKDLHDVTYQITLDALTPSSTIADVIKAINDQVFAQAGNVQKVEAGFNATQTGLRLVDKTGDNKTPFRVDTTNGSSALLQLGFLLAGNQGTPYQQANGDPDRIEGGQIGQVHLDDRFFVRDAQMRVDGLTVKTPVGGTPGDALFGIVGVDTKLDGSIAANASASLQYRDPGNQALSNDVTLAQLLARRDVAISPTIGKGLQLSYDTQLPLGQFIVGRRVFASNGANIVGSAVVVEVLSVSTSGVLRLADVEGTFGTGNMIAQYKEGIALAAATASGAVATNVNFGEFTLNVAVQPGFDDIAFGNGFDTHINGKSYAVPVHLAQFGNPNATPNPILPAAVTDVSGIPAGELAAFKNLSYSHISAALNQLLGVLQEVESNFTLLSTPLPAINKSVSDLLELVDGFARSVQNADEAFDAAIDALKPEGLDIPALRLQDIPRALRGAFGLPVGVDPDAAGAVDWVKLEFDQVANLLKVDLSLNEVISTKLGLDIESGGTLPNLTSGGVLKVGGVLDVRLNFGIDLAAPDKAYLFNTSNIAASLKVEGEGQEYSGGQAGLGLVFRAALGPLEVFIKDGDALIDVSFKLPGLDFGGGATKKLIKDVTFADFKPAQVPTDKVDIVLPMFFGGEGPDDFIGEYRAIGQIASVTVTNPDFSDIQTGIENNTIPFDPFDNILLAIDTLDIYLQTLTDRISSEVLGLRMPFVGRQLADVLFIEEFRGTLIRTLKEGIENAVSPNPDTIVEALLVTGLGPYLVGGISSSTSTGGAAADRYRQWSFTLHGSKSLVLDDFDLGLANFGFDEKSPVKVAFNWDLEITFGVDFDKGAYINVSDGDELDVDLTITLPAGTVEGQLGYLQLDASDPGSDTGAIIQFDVDVAKGTTSDAKLGFSDLGSINPIATVAKATSLASTAQALSLHLETEASPGLPELRAELAIDWTLAAGTLVSDLNGDAVVPGIQRIALENIMLNSSSVAGSLLEDVFSTVGKYIEPFMPVVDAISTPIPILSDVAGRDFTILDLAEIFGSVDADFLEAVADILDVIAAINEFANAPDLALGSLVLFDHDDGLAENFDPHDPGATLAGVDVLLSTDNSELEALLNKSANDQEDSSTTAGWTFDDDAFMGLINGNTNFLKKVKDGDLADGLTIDILTDPREGLRMLLDQTATLIEYEVPPLAVEFSYYQLFPIYGPLGVSIEIGFGFEVDLHGVGFDTYGYQRYADSGFRNEGLIFDGFFFQDLDDGVEAPEVKFEFGLVGAAELNLGIARAGVGGGIDAQILFDWHDPIGDGHVHISEILGSIEAEKGNPLAMFDVSGVLTFQLFAFLEISLIGFRQDFPITPETPLFDFTNEFKRPPVLGTKISDDTLQLNMGPNAKDRLHGDTSDGNEHFQLERDGTTVYIWSDELGVKKADWQKYENVKHIVGLGGQGNDTIQLDKFDGSKMTAEFDGGIGDDRIEYLGSTGDTDDVGAVIIGGLGNDWLVGGEGNDRIYGGEGNDVVKGGGGYDILFGDQGRVADSVTPKFISSLISEGDGNDTIEGGAGADILFGAGGDDDLKGDAGADLLVGDGGRFEYTTTGNHVNLAALRPAAYTPPTVDTPTPKDPEEISKDIDALSDFVAARVLATELGDGGNDKLAGGGDGDLIFGGSGDDHVFGDAGDDFILAGKGFDEVSGGADKDTIFGGDQADTLAGDAGDDVMAGGAGNDYMRGGTENDVMKGDTGADVMFGDAGDDQVFGQTEPDVLFGGVGNDLVVGGTSDDVIFGDNGLVAKIDPDLTDLSDDSKLIGDGNPALVTGAFKDGDIRTIDLIITDVVAGDGNDILSGDAGDDQMFGGGGNDRMGGDVDPRLPGAGSPTEISDDVLIGDGGKIVFDKRRFRSVETIIGDLTGQPFIDTIYGDNGNDYILGGRGGDFLFGGHGKVVTGGVVGASRGATDAAASDNDIIVGDNGKLSFAGEAPVADNFGILTKVQTTDTLGNTGGAEYAEGELGADVIFGGVNGSEDVLFGNAGNDVILGDNGEIDFDFADAAHDLSTLDLIRSYRDSLGGIDQVSGNAGNDVLIGGTAGDKMWGDDLNASAGGADGTDVMLGDNADIFLIGTAGKLHVQVADMAAGTAIDLITTTDQIDPAHLTRAAAESGGGPDTMEGNAGADIMLGGVNNDDGAGAREVDKLYGDRGVLAAPTAATIANDGDDILLGDNGLLDFTYVADSDRTTLDLIRSFEDGLGGKDELSGNKGLDVAIGGTDGDTIYGDDTNRTAGTADLGDLLLGDNADIFLVAKGTAAGGDLKLVFDTAVQTIRTTDEEHPEYGGSDTISGNAAGDIIAGGVQGDTLYGDRAAVTVDSNGMDGNDVILGDNGAFEWQSTGRLNEVLGIDIGQNNPDLWAKFGSATQDLDLATLDLVTTEQPNSGGRDLVYGDNGRDTIFGGTDADKLYGDTGSETDGFQSPNGSGNDIVFGDHARLYPQFSRHNVGYPGSLQASNAIYSRNFFAIDTGNVKGGEGDQIWGEEGADVLLGQQGDDRMWGGSGDDDMIGGHNVAGGYDELTAPAIGATLQTPENAMNDLMDGGSGDDALAGDNAILWRRGDDLSPRFRELIDTDGDTLKTDTPIYTTTETAITANVGSAWQSDPADAVGRDIQLVDHSDAVQTTPEGRFGKDVMAGGFDEDVMFGQLGDDLMQGDGSIGVDDGNGATITRQVVLADSGSNPDTDETLYFNVPEHANDGDDYMEGNGGSDLMYGGLGQDDMIGGSSSLFGLGGADPDVANALRPDGSDAMFGGAGVDTSRSNIGDAMLAASTAVITTTATGHARDADYMMGDNAIVYRLVEGGASGTNASDTKDKFLTFNYDNYDTTAKILPRAMQQLDYTLGGGDYAGGGYNGTGQATPGGKADNGAADLIHGESGDDVIFGMAGSDVLFGEGQDDDIIGGYGNDWISGGTGQDGVVGDDGLVFTSRNSAVYDERLYGIDKLLANDPDTKYSNGNVLDEAISTPGSIQTAVINRKDELKKTIELVPFSYDRTWIANDDEFPDDVTNTPYADDIIFGGLGSDFLHGGSGDDAISGAEALAAAYVPVYDEFTQAAKGTYDLGYEAVGIANALLGNTNTHSNPGNVLAFNSQDLDGRHQNNRFRAGEFRLYDEYDPLRRIVLTETGELAKSATGKQFLLNFDKDEGVVRPAGDVPKATGQQTPSYENVNDDGSDVIFGDLGNDWLVGGTGRDNAYGGWGNDLMNVDDNQTTNGSLNDQTDTHPTYEDRAYGGAGRDVLIANTGGDRLIDWVGEYNTYLVPFAPFGQATVSRTLQPFLPEFLYALSGADGADPTRDNYVGDPRNGEPRGELGLVLQKDFAWQDQTGAPADPQAGNIPGGPRDVLRSAGFDDQQTQGFVPESGSWSVTGGRYEVAPKAGSGTTDALSLFYVDQAVPSYFEVMATINAVKPTAGFKANSYIVFDYVSPTNFKFAGINISTNKIEVGQRTAGGWQVLASINALLKQDTDYNVLLSVNGNAVTFVVDNKHSLGYAFQPRKDADGFTYLIRDGMVGLAGDNARSRLDNMRVQVIPPVITYSATDAFSGAAPVLLAPDSGTWSIQTGRYSGTPAAGAPFALAGNDIRVGMNAMLKLDAIVRTGAAGGVVFDMYSPTDFKFAAVSVATNQVLIGHYTAKAGWVVDTAVSRTLASGTDYTVSVTLKGSTVNVTLNGQAVASRVFNSTVVDGAVGVFSRGGTASFDSFALSTDDPNVKAVKATGAGAAASKTTADVGAALNSTDAWTIDWTAVASTTSSNLSGASSKTQTAQWQEEFVLNLGHSLPRNPNADLRIWL